MGFYKVFQQLKVPVKLIITNFMLVKFFLKAELLDAAAGVHIKFRLAGVSYTCSKSFDPVF